MKRQFALLGAWVGLGTLVFSLLGCSLSKAYPAKRYFYVETSRAQSAETLKGEVLRVRTLDISRAFAGKAFVSRKSEVEYSSDYYTEFFTAPSEMLTTAVADWMKSSGLFSEVVGAASSLTPGRVIEGHIDGLYVDLREASSVRATISLQLRYIDDTGSQPEVILAKRYARAIEAASANPEQVVAGWNQAVNEILEAFETDLRNTNR